MLNPGLDPGLPRGVRVSVNFGYFSPIKFLLFHCNALGKTIKAHKNLHTNQQNEHIPEFAPTYYLVTFSENCMKMKKIEPRGMRLKFYYVDPPLLSETWMYVTIYVKLDVQTL